MRENPGIKVTEVVKQIARMWQSLTKEDKLRYKELAKQGKPFSTVNIIKIKSGTSRNSEILQSATRL